MKCPQCSAEMNPSPLPEERELVSAMVNRGSHAAYASNKAATMKEKEARLGIVYTCPNCRYITREKADPAAGAGDEGHDDAGTTAGKGAATKSKPKAAA